MALSPMFPVIRTARKLHVADRVKANKDYTAWDPSLIRSRVPVLFTAPCSPYLTMYIYFLRASANPLEDVTASVHGVVCGPQAVMMPIILWLI